MTLVTITTPLTPLLVRSELPLGSSLSEGKVAALSAAKRLRGKCLEWHGVFLFPFTFPLPKGLMYLLVNHNQKVYQSVSRMAFSQ